MSFDFSTLRQRIFTAALLTLVLVSYQNCSEQFKASDFSTRSDSSLAEDTVAVAACEDNLSFDSCIFLKNPVAQTGREVDILRAASARAFGVKLSSQLRLDQLKSADFDVRLPSGQTATSSDWKSFAKSGPHNLGALMSYYYAQDFKNRLKEVLGSYPGEGTGIPLFVGSPLAGFIYQKNEIHLKDANERFPMAQDGSIIVQYTAQALVKAASRNEILLRQDAQALSCSGQKGVQLYGHCCKTAQGCGAAIASGAADYFTAIYFNALGLSTALGEGWVNSPGGIKHCGLSRDLAVLSDLSIASSYSACSSAGSSGWIYNMGSAYASVWWEVRKKLPHYKKNLLDRLFLAHLGQVKGDDTFATASAKAYAIDKADFGGEFSANLQTEFSRRGLQ